MGIMMLAAGKGTEINIITIGPDENEGYGLSRRPNY